MGFNKKLLLAGLAAGVTAYMLYKASKKKQQQQQHQIQAPAPYGGGAQQPQQASAYSTAHNAGGTGGHNSHWGAAGAVAGLATAGAAYAAYNHHQQQTSQQPSQQPAYGAPPTSAAPSGEVTWDMLRDWRHIANLLSNCVMDQFLYPWWTFDSVARLATHIANTGSLVACADAWQLPPVLAQDLVKLALFDVMFLLDDSASMRSERNVRPDALKGILRRSADAAGRFDQDGMECAWMNSDVHQRIHTADEAARLTDACKFNGNSTPMGSALESKILGPHVLAKASSGALQKPALILVITDGRPTGSAERGDKIVQVLKQAKRTLAATRYGEDAVSFQIAAVGNDRDAQEWLDSIDSHKEVGELVDVCSDIRQEAKQVKRSINVELTEELYCLKILLGGIDASYDASDEAGHTAKHRERNRAAKEARFGQEAAAFRAAKDQALGPVGAPASALPSAPAPNAYGQAGGYPGQPPQQQPSYQPYGTQQPQPAYGQPPAPSPYGGAAPGGQYGAPPQPQAPYGQPPQPQASYGQPPQHAYGQPPAAAPYGGGGGGFPDPSSYMQTAPPPYGGYGDMSRAGADAGPPQPWGGAQPQPPQQPPQQGFPAGTGGFGMPTPNTNASPYSSYPPY